MRVGTCTLSASPKACRPSLFAQSVTTSRLYSICLQPSPAIWVSCHLCDHRAFPLYVCRLHDGRLDTILSTDIVGKAKPISLAQKAEEATGTTWSSRSILLRRVKQLDIFGRQTQPHDLDPPPVNNSRRTWACGVAVDDKHVLSHDAGNSSTCAGSNSTRHLRSEYRSGLASTLSATIATARGSSPELHGGERDKLSSSNPLFVKKAKRCRPSNE